LSKGQAFSDVSFFKLYREVEHRDGSRQIKWPPCGKHLQPAALRQLLEAANRRYLEFLSAIKDPRKPRDEFDKLSKPVQQQGRSYS